MAIKVEKKYGVLRMIALGLKLLSVLTIVLSIVGGLGELAQMNAPQIFGGIVGGVLIWALAEVISLFIGIEENTRKTHILLERERT